MKEELKKLMCELLTNDVKVVSWGVSNIENSNTKLEFQVNGLLYKGKVVIKVSDHQYTITLGDKSIQCGLNEIVTTLDGLIERSDDYEQKLGAWVKSTYKHD